MIYLVIGLASYGIAIVSCAYSQYFPSLDSHWYWVAAIAGLLSVSGMRKAEVLPPQGVLVVLFSALVGISCGVYRDDFRLIGAFALVGGGAAADWIGRERKWGLTSPALALSLGMLAATFATEIGLWLELRSIGSTALGWELQSIAKLVGIPIVSQGDSEALMMPWGALWIKPGAYRLGLLVFTVFAAAFAAISIQGLGRELELRILIFVPIICIGYLCARIFALAVFGEYWTPGDYSKSIEPASVVRGLAPISLSPYLASKIWKGEKQ